MLEKSAETIIKDKELELNYKIPQMNKNKTLIYYQTKNKNKSTIEIFKDLLNTNKPLNKHFPTILNEVNSSNDGGNNINLVTAKFLLPLIGNDAQVQKRNLEDEENSFKIKLKKLKRFKNKSMNFESTKILDGQNKLLCNQLNFPNDKMIIKEDNHTSRADKSQNKSIKIYNAQKSSYKRFAGEVNGEKSIRRLNRKNKKTKSLVIFDDSQNNYFIQENKSNEKYKGNDLNLAHVKEKKGCKDSNDNSILGKKKNFYEKEQEGNNNNLIPMFSNFTKPNKYKIFKNNYKLVKNRVMNNKHKSNEYEELENCMIYYKAKFNKNKNNNILYDKEDEHIHPFIKGDSSFKQYSYRSLDNQIKIKNLIERELQSLNKITNIANKNMREDNRDDEYNNSESIDSLSKSKTNYNLEIENNLNIFIPYDAKKLKSEFELESLLTKGLGEVNYKAKLQEMMSQNSKKFLNFTKNPSFLKNNEHDKHSTNKDYHTNNNNINNTTSDKNVKNKNYDDEQLSKYIKPNDQFMNYKIHHKSKNNFHQVMKLNSNNRKKFNSIDFNYNNNDFIIENKQNDCFIKDSYLNDQLKIRPKNKIPKEIQYFLEHQFLKEKLSKY